SRSRTAPPARLRPTMADDGNRDRRGAGGPRPLDLTLPSGRLRAHISGARGGPTVIGIPGISSNSRAFDTLARRLAADGRCVGAARPRAGLRRRLRGAGARAG